MKWIIYKKKVGEANIGTENEPIWKPVLQDMGAEYSPENEIIVKTKAYNGEYTIEDDGVEEVVETTAQDDTDAMLIDHEYRLTLLELGLVE